MSRDARPPSPLGRGPRSARPANSAHMRLVMRACTDVKRPGIDDSDRGLLWADFERRPGTLSLARWLIQTTGVGERRGGAGGMKGIILRATIILLGTAAY